MRKHGLEVLAALVTAFVSAAPQPAHAYKCSRVATNSGPSLVWNTRAIDWYVAPNLLDIVVSEDRTGTEELVRLSFSAWQDVACSDITMPYRGQRAGASAGYVDGGPNQNVVVAVGSGWRHDNGAIAVTTSAYDPRTGVVVDADIEVNSQHFEFVNADATCRSDAGSMDLRNTLTHEVGHILGLDHPPNTRANQDSTMFASAPPCETKKQTLADDDVRGLCAIYPSGAPTVPCFPAESTAFVVAESDDGYGCDCQAVPPDASSSAVLALVAFAWLRRKRPRSLR